MISSRDAVVIRQENLPDRGAGGSIVYILKQPNDRIVIKRYVERGRVVNFIDRYERASERGIETLPLDENAAQQIMDAALSGKTWAACFVLGETSATPLAWVRSEAEHRYTSTGVKFWRHREAMESYQAGGGRSIISTHVSPEGACNLKCPFCSVTYRDTHARIALPRIQKYLTDLKARGLKAVILTGGGEPTLYPHFNELVRWIHTEGLSVALITNGTMTDRVEADVWSLFSWVRVSINIFDGWREKIRLDRSLLTPNCVVGASFVYSIEHEAAKEDVPIDRLELFRQISKVADRVGATYIRVLPNCLLPQDQLVAEHRSIQAIANALGDERYFHQYKVHGAPEAVVCHQSYFRPYLSEEPFGEGGEPGTVYPCDSVVLNESSAHFAKRYQLCRAEDVLDYLDGKIATKFTPRKDCSGCVFTSNVEMLDAWKNRGEERFKEFAEPLVHEEFV